MMVCPLPQNYSSPMDYQNYLVVNRKWYETTQGVPLPPLLPPPPKKKAISGLPPTHTQKKKNKDPEKKWEKKEKKGSYLCESSLGGPAWWRAFMGKGS